MQRKKARARNLSVLQKLCPETHGSLRVFKNDTHMGGYIGLDPTVVLCVVRPKRTPLLHTIHVVRWTWAMAQTKQRRQRGQWAPATGEGRESRSPRLKCQFPDVTVVTVAHTHIVGTVTINTNDDNNRGNINHMRPSRDGCSKWRHKKASGTLSAGV